MLSKQTQQGLDARRKMFAAQNYSPDQQRDEAGRFSADTSTSAGVQKYLARGEKKVEELRSKLKDALGAFVRAKTGASYKPGDTVLHLGFGKFVAGETGGKERGVKYVGPKNLSSQQHRKVGAGLTKALQLVNR